MDQANTLREMLAANKEREKLSAMSARVITVTSGKGGVGKTNFTVNLAIYLRGMGKKVVIIDADFGLANIEVLFGVVPKYSLADIIFSTRTIDEVLTDGPNGLKFVSGGQGLGELANLNEKQMTYILENFGYLDKVYDIVLIDTGAGISKSVVNFIKAGGEAIIITTPEPTAITDAYALVKTLAECRGENGLPEIKVVVNRADDKNEGAEVFAKLSSVAARFLDVKMFFLGSIPYDRQLVKAVKKQQPLAMVDPKSDFMRALEEIGGNLLDIPPKKAHNQQGIKSFVKKLANVFARG